MKAEIEQLDGRYILQEMGEPECGKDFCDICGDCLVCDNCSCRFWVIYLNNPKNPNYDEHSENSKQTD